MKVLFANKFFFLNGGSERVFFQERDYLMRHGAKIIDFSMDDQRNLPSPYSDYFVSNIDYYSSTDMLNKLKQAAKLVHSPEAIYKLKKLINVEKPEIAHLHNIYHQLTPSIIAILKEHGVKVVMTLHDGKLICPSYLMLAQGKICTACKGHSFWMPLAKHCMGSRGQELLLMVEAYWHKWAQSYEQVDLFLSPSRFHAELISSRVPPEKMRVLPNGIDLTAYQPNFNDQGYALYFGRLSSEKGIATLLKAHEVKKDGIALKVIGTGPLEGELRARYSKVEFLGYKEGATLKALIADASFVVVPSECYENFPMTVLEAMALGKPVIGSRIGGIPEQIEDCQTGFLFEMGDVEELAEKMSVLTARPDLRKKMGMAARKKVEEKYSLTMHCTTLVNFYKELIGNA